MMHMCMCMPRICYRASITLSGLSASQEECARLQSTLTCQSRKHTPTEGVALFNMAYLLYLRQSILESPRALCFRVPRVPQAGAERREGRRLATLIGTADGADSYT